MNMITVKRGNVILDIPSDDKERYMKDGYSVIDDKGNVIEEAMPCDVATLKAMVASLKAENAELKAKLAKPAKSNEATKKASNKED